MMEPLNPALPLEGRRQIERATRVFEGHSDSARPVHKVLEQLYSETKRGRGRTSQGDALHPQDDSSAAGGEDAEDLTFSPFAPWRSRILQGPEAQNYERQLASFTLKDVAADAARASGVPPGGDPTTVMSISDFLQIRRKRVVSSVVLSCQADLVAKNASHHRGRMQGLMEADRRRFLREHLAKANSTRAGAASAAAEAPPEGDMGEESDAAASAYGPDHDGAGASFSADAAARPPPHLPRPDYGAAASPLAASRPDLGRERTLAAGLPALSREDRRLREPALVLTLALKSSEMLLDETCVGGALHVPSLVAEHLQVQSREGRQAFSYFHLLGSADREEALSRLLLEQTAGAIDELLGAVDGVGLPKTGSSWFKLESRLEATEVSAACRSAGRAAALSGRYREALRLLHCADCHQETMTVLVRAARAMSNNPKTAATEAEFPLLLADLRRYFSLYEHSPVATAMADRVRVRKFFAAGLFSARCREGLAEAAFELLDSEQLIDFSCLPVAPAAPGAGLPPAPPAPNPPHPPLLTTAVRRTHAPLPTTAVTDALLVVMEHQHILTDYAKLLLAHAGAPGSTCPQRIRRRILQLQSYLAYYSVFVRIDDADCAALAKVIAASRE